MPPKGGNHLVFEIDAFLWKLRFFSRSGRNLILIPWSVANIEFPHTFQQNLLIAFKAEKTLNLIVTIMTSAQNKQSQQLLQETKP